MGDKLETFDSHAGWQTAQKAVDLAVRGGKLEPEKARVILDKAREAYRNNDANRMIDKVNKGFRSNK